MTVTTANVKLLTSPSHKQKKNIPQSHQEIIGQKVALQHNSLNRQYPPVSLMAVAAAHDPLGEAPQCSGDISIVRAKRTHHFEKSQGAGRTQTHFKDSLACKRAREGDLEPRTCLTDNLRDSSSAISA